MKTTFLLSVLSSLLIITGCRQKEAVTSSHLGEIHFEVNGKEESMPDFNEGMLLLHSFEYDDAADAFSQALDIDSGFVMAYWGLAMTYNHPIWQEQDMDKGNEILHALAPKPEGRVEKAKSEMEKDFISAINILFGKGDKTTRDSSYAEWMKTLYNKYPGNNEVAAFYSLALNGWGTTDRDKKIMEKAAEIGYEILKRNPKHPGALHYIIHAYDDPKYAELALTTADEYATVAPDAGHALHMPTHTYLALGLWDKVVSSNIVSWEASKKRKEKKKLDNNALGYHQFHWLGYGYLQRGEKEIAKAMVDSMYRFYTELPSPRAKVHMIMMKATYLAETNEYGGSLDSIKLDPEDLNIATRARYYFTEGMTAYIAGNKKALDSIIHQLADERVTEDLKTPDKGIRMCGNINPSMATKTDLLDAETMESELRALTAWMNKDATGAEKFFIKATELQSKSGYAFGPPTIVKPSFELYGEWLLEVGRPKEALEQFEASLRMTPNKRLSLMGKEAALKQI